MGASIVIGVIVVVFIGLIGVNIQLSLWLRGFRRGVPAEAVVVLGRGKPWSRLIADYDKSDLEAIVRFLERRGKDFSFYVHPDGEQVRRIMADGRVREVFFVGHGGPHFFRLGRGEILYYCAFADAGLYGKELVHQVHCGGPGGISLIERVVPVENRHRCFYFGREIRSRDVQKGFERLRGFYPESHAATGYANPAKSRTMKNRVRGPYSTARFCRVYPDPEGI